MIHPYNPAHAVATCTDCVEEMIYNVPRLGPDGGYVHKTTHQVVCGPVIGSQVLADTINRARGHQGPPEKPIKFA